MTPIENLAALFATELCRAVTAVSVLNLPGFKQVPPAARAFLGFAIALACFSAKSATPVASGTLPSGFWLTCGRNFFCGMVVALLWNVVMEACSLAIQLASVQSGLSYASIIDPTNDTESGSLLGITQFCVLLTFLAGGVHLEFLAALLDSDRLWNGFSQASNLLGMLKEMLGFGFRTGLRLAAPFIASMLLLDIASALGARFAERFQLSMLIFPVKWAATLIILMASTTTLHYMEAALAKQAFRYLGAAH
jgi:flagellar biosynthesis protein FliR